jgi:hypothetical protein
LRSSVRFAADDSDRNGQNRQFSGVQKAFTVPSPPIALL